MDDRVKGLIAIAASAAVNRYPCMERNLAVCDRLGIGREEIAAAIEVGLAVNKGAAGKTRDKVTALLGLAKEPEGARVAAAVPDVFAAHHASVRGILLRVVRDEALADDLVQEALLRAASQPVFLTRSSQGARRL